MQPPEGFPLRRAKLGDQISEMIAQRIASGELAPGQQLPTERQLAQTFGVSIPVIREAAETLVRRNLIHRRQGKGTFVRRDALEWIGDSPRLRGTIALVASWTEGGGYYSQVLAGLSETMTRQRWALQLVPPCDMPAETVCQQILARGVDGVVWIDYLKPGDREAVRQLAQRVPVVLFNWEPGDPSLMAVRVDNRGGSAAAARHLIGLGHSRILVVTNFTDKPPHRERLEGFERAIRSECEALDVFEIAYYFPNEEERDRFRAILPRYSAVYFTSGYLFRWFATELTGSGRQVPSDLSVVVFDDSSDLHVWTPPITAMRQPLPDMVRTALALIDDWSHGLSVRDTDRVFDPELVVRDSTAPADGYTPDGVR